MHSRIIKLQETDYTAKQLKSEWEKKANIKQIYWAINPPSHLKRTIDALQESPANPRPKTLQHLPTQLLQASPPAYLPGHTQVPLASHN